jgi:putative transposase
MSMSGLLRLTEIILDRVVNRVDGEVTCGRSDLLSSRWSQPLEARVLRPPLESAQYRAVRYTQRLAGAGAVASVGSRGDSYDNALAEAFNSLFKAELVRTKGPWRSIDDLEIAVAEYIDWFNHRRLHGEIGMIPPVEANSPTTIHILPSEQPSGSSGASTEPGAQHFRSRRKNSIRSTITLGVAVGSWPEPLERSSRPISPNSRERCTHVLAQTLEMLFSVAT